ncbi:MAG: Re/Si-specific NAD(P)(+) transhydrogenase subunit alpha [Thaumarchaeota archaeon]|nr:MAG: Re/Si-specific NAD(P)(+) transhydrogenase subunit alpha [Nitrososphaerota archaeon]
MIAGIPRETTPGEKRVSLVPENISKLAGLQVTMERGAGEPAGYPDSAYEEKGAIITDDARSLYGGADLILKVMPPTPSEAGLLKEGSTLISFLYPMANIEAVKKLTARRTTVFAMELMPRISRAQSMDALSSQATLAGYKAVLIAADSLPRLFPLLMTAAGTIPAAKVFVVGAGVAGLQAIAAARRLGAIVEAYDVRPAVKEQVASLGARFVELPVEAKEAQDAGGYAKAQSEEFYTKQQRLLAEHAEASDVVITTALVPGQRAPQLISEEAIRGMRPGSVVVDLAAEQGGNCALTEPGKTVVKHGVTIHGPLNLPSTMAPQASQLYSRNITSFLLTMLKNGSLTIDLKDELMRGPLVIQGGEVLHQPTKLALEQRRP